MMFYVDASLVHYFENLLRCALFYLGNFNFCSCDADNAYSLQSHATKVHSVRIMGLTLLT